MIYIEPRLGIQSGSVGDRQNCRGQRAHLLVSPGALSRRRRVRHACRRRPDPGLLGQDPSTTDSTVPATAQLNCALHTVALCRLQRDLRTRADPCRAEGKTNCSIGCCLKRYIVRELKRRLESPPSTA